MSISAVSAPHAGAAALNKVLDVSSATAKTEATGKGRKDAPGDIKRAASQFEAIILRQLLTPTIEPIMNGGMGGAGGTGGGVYGYMLTDVLADSLSKGGGLGLTQMLSRQLTPRGLPPVEAVATPPVAADAANS